MPFERLKVKVTLESQMIKWSLIELVRVITSTFMHEFQNNFVQLFFLRSSSAVLNIWSGTLKVKVILEGQMIKWV